MYLQSTSLKALKFNIENWKRAEDVQITTTKAIVEIVGIAFRLCVYLYKLHVIIDLREAKVAMRWYRDWRTAFATSAVDCFFFSKQLLSNKQHRIPIYSLPLITECFRCQQWKSIDALELSTVAYLSRRLIAYKWKHLVNI